MAANGGGWGSGVIPSTVTISLGKAIRSLEDEQPYRHIHAEMRLEVGGRVVPHMGFFGPTDVCVRDWVEEIHAVIAAFERGETVYVFDEGEQNQPAFRFERDGDTGYLSIVDSGLSEGKTDADFQRVPFDCRDVTPALHIFGDALVERLTTLAPSQVEYWRGLIWPAT